MWNGHFLEGGDLPHLVCQVWAVRVWIKICEIAIFWGYICHIWSAKYELSESESKSVKWPFSGAGRSATPGLPSMTCQSLNQNLWNHHSMGGRSATPGLPSMSCQSMNQNLWNHQSTVRLDLPYLVCQIWAARVWIKICEIIILWGVDLPHLVYQIWAIRVWINICEMAILWAVDLPYLVCQIWAVRVGIKLCKITNLQWG